MGIKQPQVYRGFEQGPIRPPSEANSLLIRVTRNCPWNRCAFCPVYKGTRFSLRPVEHVIADIDDVYTAVSIIRDGLQKRGGLSVQELSELSLRVPELSRPAFYAAANWLGRGGDSVFLQDANSPIIKPDWLVEILDHLKRRFPWVERVTSYARSHTVNRISDEDMERIAAAGLNRIHIGLESGSDTVLKLMSKGVTKEQHIAAGRRVKRAGVELSEYVMPGLGGSAHSEEHAAETADALNQINPDFIRLRTLTIPDGVPLAEIRDAGDFEKCSGLGVAREIRALVSGLDGITSTFKSDHNNNLLPEVEGRLPEDREEMLRCLDAYLALPPEEQALFQVGRRLGLFQRLSELDDPDHRVHAEKARDRLGIAAENVDAVLDERLPGGL